MPTSTWENLPADKQERILRAQIDEFGANGFSSGRLNVVARQAGVSKGSLFQYFDDKLDMFPYVCDAASVRVRDEMLERAAHAVVHDDLFDLLRAVTIDWVVVSRDHPRERSVTFAVNAPSNPEFEPAFDLAGSSGDELTATVHGYVDVLEAAFSTRNT